MNKSIIYIGLLIVSQSSFAGEKNRPMNEMQGDCSNYKMNLQDDMQAWDKPSVVVSESGSILFSKRSSLALMESEKVKLPLPPQKTFPIEGKRYAGVFTLRPEKSGHIRVSAGSRLWFDLVDKANGTMIESSEFEMQTACKKILKAVMFPVEAKKVYTFQVSSSSAPQADFIFSLQ